MQNIELPHNSEEHSSIMLERMPATDEFQIISDIFKQLCDTSRIRIFWLLCHYEECVINISALVDMSSPAVSHHLRQLKAGGLITSSRKGKEVYYKAAETEEADLLHHMIEKLVEISCPSGQYSEQTKLITEIHDFLIQNLDKRFTIEELSKKYLINTSSLKSIFKAVYGLPISAYVKEYRIKKAMEMLRDTTDSISEIANAVGYKTQSKFTQAFKDATNILPTEYRKLYHSN